MSNEFAAVSCTLEAYPFEGGSYTLTPGQIRSVQMEKSIREGNSGRAIIKLAPGGPLGVDSSPTWIEVLTPMSHVLIGMSRGDRAAIVLDGVIVRAYEDQQWTTTARGASAVRVQTLEVADFSWFFRTFNWYALTFVGITASTAVGEKLGFAPAGIPALLDQGLLAATGAKNSNPALVAQRWYTEVMAGQNAILGKTFLPYQGGSRVPFAQAVSTLWENYPDVYIPYGDYFMATEGSWMGKFLDILPFPWYEFFIATAQTGDYVLASGATGVVASGRLFTMASQPLAPPAGPQIVARVNPVPTLSITADASSQNSKIGTLDMTRWNALPVDLPDAGFYASNIEFSAEGARNFYMLNPTWYGTMFGVNNANNIPFPFSFIGAADPASVHRYGFRPQIATTRWVFDPQGAAGQDPELNIPQSIASLIGKVISWSHPQPLMARGTAVFPLMPDVMVGMRFRYAPFKDPALWDFYIEDIRHTFDFGGQSTTTLTLSRGLPASVYTDPASDGVLQGVHVGNAMRFNGEYVTGLPKGLAPALVTFGSPESITSVMGELAQVFVTPQKK